MAMVLTFDGCDVMTITFLFYKTNESAIKMSCWLIVACCWSLGSIQIQRLILVNDLIKLI